MSKDDRVNERGQGMPTPTPEPAEARVQVQKSADEVYEIARQGVVTWLGRVDQNRNAKLRSRLLSDHEIDLLRVSYDDLCLSWKNIDLYASAIKSHASADGLTTSLISAIFAEYIRGIGAAGILAKQCGLPTLSDIQAVNKVRAKILRGSRGRGRQERLAVTVPLILEGKRKAEANGTRLSLKHLLRDVNVALEAEDLDQISEATLRRDAEHLEMRTS